MRPITDIRWSATGARSRGVLGGRCEHQLARGGAAPFLDPTLKGAQLAIRESAGELILEACEEFLADTVGLGLEPRAHARPDRHERIRTGPPIAGGAGRAAVGRADFAVLPRRGQALEKTLEASLVAHRDVGRLPADSAVR